MGLLGTFKKEGKLLGDISGVTAVAHAVEHPLNWKNDAMAAAVIGSYAFGGPISGGAFRLGERLLAKRALEVAPAEVGTALHAAWGTPSAGNGGAMIARLLGRRPAGNAALQEIAARGGLGQSAMAVRQPGFLARALENRTGMPMSEIKSSVGGEMRDVINGPDSIISGNNHSAAALIQRLLSQYHG